MLLSKLPYAIFRKVVILLEKMVSYNYTAAKSPNVSLDIIRDYNRNRMAIPNKIICNAPFQHMYFKQDGKVTACCATTSSPYGDIRKESVKDIWHGKKVKVLREHIENYHLSGGCTGCRHSLESSNYSAFIGRIYDSIWPVSSSEYPTEMTFETSNICNLECIMCNGEFSSLIRKNIEQLPELPNHYDEHFLQQITPFLPHLKKVRFMGGEPFLIKEYLPIMNFLTAQHPTCKIYIQTNGTVLNHSVKKIVESPNVEISISLDSLKKETYETIRKNASFERMMDNLAYFSQRARLFNQVININFCVMQNNWAEVPDIIQYCSEHHFTLNLLPVENPRHLSLRLMEEKTIQDIYHHTLQHQHVADNYLLKQVLDGYLHHLIYLQQQARSRFERNTHLQEQPIEALYLLAKKLFSAVNTEIDGKEVGAIFEDAYIVFEKLSVTERKEVLSNLIVDMESVATDNIIPQKYEELQAKTSRLFKEIIKAYH